MDAGAGAVDAGPETLSVDVLSTQPYMLAGTTYQARQLAIRSSVDPEPVFALFVPGCTATCPVVVISEPYKGIDWTQDPVDARWAGRTGASAGYTWPDEDGPGYVPQKTIGTVRYALTSTTDLGNEGGIFLLNHVSVLVVLDRFYHGRNMEAYVSDFVRADNALPLIHEVDPTHVGFLGISLGGFVALGAQARVTVPPQALVLESPLMSLTAQFDYVDSLPGAVPATKLGEYQQFFDPYLRRVTDFTKGPPAAVPQAFTPYEPDARAKSLRAPTLLMHDDWDTLVPVAPSRALAKASTKDVEAVFFQHATPVNFATFDMNHQQPSEGLSANVGYSLYEMFFLQHLLPAPAPVTLYYDHAALAKAMGEFHAASQRGQDVSWLRPRLVDFCRPGLLLYDLSTDMSAQSPTEVLAAIASNVWGTPTTPATACAWASAFTK